MGKEHVREALGTSDYREACRKVACANMRWKTFFEDERVKLAAIAAPEPPDKRLLLSLSERDAHEIAARHLARLEKRFRDWWQGEWQGMNQEERLAEICNLATEAEVFSGGSDVHPAEYGADTVRKCMDEEGLECPPKSPAFGVLRPLLLAVRAEHAKRSLDLLEARPVVARDTLFRDVFAHSPLAKPRRETTVGELLQRFAKAQKDGGRSQGTQTTYEIPARILREVLGTETPLSAVTKEAVEGLFDLLRVAPQNAAQRYKGMTLRQAIAAADKAKDERRLKSKTLANYFNNIVTVFNFAVEKRFILENPAKDKWLRQSFGEEDEGPKAQFTTDELNALFRTPLYTGCVDDVNGYAKSGPCHPRRGRFWVPLLALWHGLRCNEACQLYTEDVKERDGITYLAIREKREDGSKCDKRLKTKQSEREVPLHPALKRIGFLAFVAERQRDKASPRLFPELEASRTGYFSNPFSKWFSRFKTGCVGGTKATFHSFRHHFRDATRAARLPAETVALLAGWEDGGNALSLQMNRYGRGAEFFKTLAEDLAKVEYPGLDLSHLVPITRGTLAGEVEQSNAELATR